nr:hypothetical protein [Tanacetum cinerariifolium]
MGFMHVSISDYGRKMVNDVNVEIHRVKFKFDFFVLDYANEGEPSIMFGRNFLATTKIQVDFGLGEIRMNLTMFEEVNGVIDLLEEVGSSSEEFVKIGKANRNKGYNINKLTPPPSLKLEDIPSTFTIPPQPIYYPHLKTKGEDERSKKLDEILMGKERINKKDFSEEDKVGIIEHNLPKKMCDPENYVLPVKINGVVEMVALVDTGASVSVLPYSLYKDLGLGDPRLYQTNLTMTDNTLAKAIGEVKNVRIQIGYQAYVVDLLVLDILVDPELPLLLGRPFLRTCGAIIDMGREELDTKNQCLLKETRIPTQARIGSSEQRKEPRGLKSSWGDWNASLNEVERRNVWRNSMFIRNNYMLEHSMSILHHLADQGNFAYPTYEPPNIPSYLYPYIPYPHSYTHYPNPGNQSNQRGSYVLGGDDYFTSAMPDFGGNFLGYAVGGSSRGAGFDDEDMDE